MPVPRPPADGLLERVQALTPLIAAHTVVDVDLVAEGVGGEMVRRLEEQARPPEPEEQQ